MAKETQAEAQAGGPCQARRGALFADLADSTRLYRELGDARAREVVLRALDLVRSCIEARDGQVVDRIGDELFCVFEGVGAMVQAALDAQDAVQCAADGTDLPIFVRLRIGFHHGPVVLDGARVFGDTVYLAKRVASMAKAQQVLTTEETLAEFADGDIMARFVDSTLLKGRDRPTRVFELIFGPGATVLVDGQETSGLPHGTQRVPTLELVSAGERTRVGPARPSLTLGRDENCDLVIDSPIVSRVHGRVELRKRGFFFVDLSTNGSCVCSGTGRPRYVRRDELRLEGRGRLVLGPHETSGVPTVDFELS